MAIGAIQALKQAKLLSRTIVAGIDATPDGLAAMKAGDLKATVFQKRPCSRHRSRRHCAEARQG